MVNSKQINTETCFDILIPGLGLMTPEGITDGRMNYSLELDDFSTRLSVGGFIIDFGGTEPRIMMDIQCKCGRQFLEMSAIRGQPAKRKPEGFTGVMWCQSCRNTIVLKELNCSVSERAGE